MTLATRIRENRAVYAAAGAGDLAVEKIREVPDRVTKVRAAVARYQDQVRGNVGRYQEGLRGNMTRLQERVEVKDIPGAAVAYVTQVGSRTVEVFDGLAERGRKVVHRTPEDAAEVSETRTRRAPGQVPHHVKPTRTRATTVKKDQLRARTSVTGRGGA